MNTALTINEQHARDMYQAGKHGYTTSDNSWCTPASYYLEDLDAAIRYVGSRSAADVAAITHEVNSKFRVSIPPLDSLFLLRPEYDRHMMLSLCAVMYDKVSIAVSVSRHSRNWTIIIDDGDCLDIEPVQAIAYLLARFW